MGSSSGRITKDYGSRSGSRLVPTCTLTAEASAPALDFNLAPGPVAPLGSVSSPSFSGLRPLSVRPSVRGFTCARKAVVCSVLLSAMPAATALPSIA